jgi:hypothetical protein
MFWMDFVGLFAARPQVYAFLSQFTWQDVMAVFAFAIAAELTWMDLRPRPGRRVVCIAAYDNVYGELGEARGFYNIQNASNPERGVITVTFMRPVDASTLTVRLAGNELPVQLLGASDKTARFRLNRQPWNVDPLPAMELFEFIFECDAAGGND